MVDRPLVPAPYVSPAEFRVQQRPRQEREADQEERVIRRVDAPENVIRGRHVQQAQIHAEVREGGLCPGPAEKQQQSGEERGLAENARREPPHASLVQRANLATAVRRHVFRNGAGARAGHPTESPATRQRQANPAWASESEPGTLLESRSPRAPGSR